MMPSSNQGREEPNVSVDDENGRHKFHDECVDSSDEGFAKRRRYDSVDGNDCDNDDGSGDDDDGCGDNDDGCGDNDDDGCGDNDDGCGDNDDDGCGEDDDGCGEDNDDGCGEDDDDCGDDNDGYSDEGSELNSTANQLSYEERLSKALAKMVCGTQHATPQLIESESFIEFVRCCNPFAQFGDVQSIKNECNEIYKIQKEKVKQVLTTFDRKISLSVEVLGCYYDHMRITAHFIDDSWKLKNWVLNLYNIYGEPDLAEVIQKSLSDWGIESKISTITLTKRSGSDGMVEILKDHIFKSKNIQLYGKLFRVCCCADILSRMVQKALSVIPEIINEIRQLVICGRETPYWHNTYHTIKEAYEFYSMGEFSKDDYEGSDIPPADDWKKVEGICRLLKTIQDVARVFFETKHSMANVYLYNFQELRASLIEASTSSDDFIRPVAEKLLKKFDKYWKDMFLVLAIAAVMDPRCKMKYLEFSSSKYKDNDGNSKVTMVLEAINSLYGDYSSHATKQEYIFSDLCYDSCSDSESDDEGVRGRNEESLNPEDGAVSWLQEYNQFIQSDTQVLKSESELDSYLEDPVVPWSENFDILSWWRDASLKYPTVSRMARDILAIPLSVATSYEAYYAEPRPMEPNLLGSGSDVMEALACTQSWRLKH